MLRTLDIKDISTTPPSPQKKKVNIKGVIECRQKVHKKTTQIKLHEYYTPKTIIIQGFLFKITIFVNYADFYVNTIMST